jgi:hypothetical protein
LPVFRKVEFGVKIAPDFYASEIRRYEIGRFPHLVKKQKQKSPDVIGVFNLQYLRQARWYGLSVAKIQEFKMFCPHSWS